MSATCRSCGAPIIWCVTEKGKRMPLDVGLVDHGPGRFLIDVTTDPETAISISAESPNPGRVSHFSSCPNAAQHRRPR